MCECAKGTAPKELSATLFARKLLERLYWLGCVHHIMYIPLRTAAASHLMSSGGHSIATKVSFLTAHPRTYTHTHILYTSSPHTHEHTYIQAWINTRLGVHHLCAARFWMIRNFCAKKFPFFPRSRGAQRVECRKILPSGKVTLKTIRRGAVCLCVCAAVCVCVIASPVKSHQFRIAAGEMRETAVLNSSSRKRISR